MRIASNFEIRRLLDISKAWCDAIDFFGNNPNKQDEEKDFIKDWIFTSKKPIWQRIIPSALQSYFYSTTYAYYS